MKIILVLLSYFIFASAQSPFILTKFQSVYPLVEIYTDKVPSQYKEEITDIIKEYAKEMKVSTKGYSKRPLAIIISRVAIGNTLVLKVQLLLGEEVKRLDDGEEVFALTYQKEDIFEVESLEEDLIDSVEYLLEDFKDQYIEDNELDSQKSVTTYKEFATEYKYETDYAKALQRAKREKKDILLVQVTNYCPWCRKLEKKVLSSRKVNKEVQKNYIPLIVNREEGTLDKRFDTPIVPVTYIISYKDDTKFEAKPGYKSKSDFLYMIKKK